MGKIEGKKGYKKTELGWVPVEWEVKKIKDIGIIKSGSTPLRANYDLYFRNGTIYWIKTLDLNNNEITEVDEKITEIALQESSCSIIPKDSVLVAMYGGFNQIGRTGLLTMNAAINQALSAIIIDKNTIVSKYLLHWLNKNVGYWKNFAASSRKDPNITKRDVENFPILLPPISEQKKIAQILFFWDKAIEKIEKLINARSRLKKGLMQKLLTGKKRFKEFIVSFDRYNTEIGNLPIDWNYIEIKNIAEEVKLRNAESKPLTVLSCTKYKGLVDSLEYFGKQIFSKDTSDYKLVKHNQFAYATNHIEEGSIGYQDLYDEALISPMYTVFDTCKENL